MIQSAQRNSEHGSASGHMRHRLVGEPEHTRDIEDAGNERQYPGAEPKPSRQFRDHYQELFRRLLYFWRTSSPLWASPKTMSAAELLSRCGPVILISPTIS